VTARPARLPRALAGLALTLLLPLSACAGTDSSTADSSGSATGAPTSSATGSQSTSTDDAGQQLEVRVEGGRVSGDTGRVPVASGTHVVLTITSDTADEFHVHGYDLEGELEPGKPATVEFDATIPGVFEVELHEAGTVLLSLQVG
jgi:hypothetical protein